MLNPDASDEQLLVQLRSALETLAAEEPAPPGKDAVAPPDLRLVHSTLEPEEQPTGPRSGLPGTARTSSGLRVVG